MYDCIIITDNGFDALFAANKIVASVREKARTHPLRLAGLVGNRNSKRDLSDKYVEACPMPILEVLPLIEDIRICRVYITSEGNDIMKKCRALFTTKMFVMYISGIWSCSPVENMCLCKKLWSTRDLYLSKMLLILSDSNGEPGSGSNKRASMERIYTNWRKTNTCLLNSFMLVNKRPVL
jgi:hypothetical protein